MPDEKPTWFSLQTVLTVIGVATVLIGWGYTFSSLQQDTSRNTASVQELTLDLEKNDSKTDQLETRLIALEKIASDAVTLRRDLDKALSEFKSDVAVIKEVLERLETQRRDRP